MSSHLGLLRHYRQQSARKYQRHKIILFAWKEEGKVLVIDSCYLQGWRFPPLPSCAYVENFKYFDFLQMCCPIKIHLQTNIGLNMQFAILRFGKKITEMGIFERGSVVSWAFVADRLTNRIY